MATSIRKREPVQAQSPPKIAPMHVHHVHLNSVDPKAAAGYQSLRKYVH
jgi:hypothetical protein